MRLASWNVITSIYNLLLAFSHLRTDFVVSISSFWIKLHFLLCIYWISSAFIFYNLPSILFICIIFYVAILDYLKLCVQGMFIAFILPLPMYCLPFFICHDVGDSVWRLFKNQLTNSKHWKTMDKAYNRSLLNIQQGPMIYPLGFFNVSAVMIIQSLHPV